MRSKILIGLILICLTCVHFWIRSSAMSLPYFHNEDTAGISYSADLILRGGLPMVDTVEMKAPGSFFLLAGWWAVIGRSLENAQVLVAIWSWIGALGIAVGAWLLYRSIWAVFFSSTLYILLAPFTDSMDINYGAWMITPYIWAANALWWVLAQRRPTQDEKTSSWIFVGLLIALAALMKRQGSAVFPLAICILYWGNHRKINVSRLLLGLGIGYGLFFSYYAYQGHLQEGILHYFFSKSGWSYLTSSIVTDQQVLSENIPKWPRFWDGICGLPYHLPTALTLAISSQILASPFVADTTSNTESIHPDKYNVRQMTFLWIFFILSFAGAGLGFRFFKGYYLQILPSLLWLGVYPHGWRKLSGLGSRYTAKKILRNYIFLSILLGMIVCWPIALNQSHSHFKRTLKMRSGPLYLPTTQIHKISHYINTMESQSSLKQHKIAANTMWVWGRWAWPAYFYTQSTSPTRYFKNLGVLTTQLSNTWNPKRVSKPTRFDPHSPWPEAIAELHSKPPQWIIIARNESRHGFKKLAILLSSLYQKQSYDLMGLKAPKSRHLFEVYRLK